jgi:hypothetical protein
VRKRTSKRRWLRRCEHGDRIPAEAIIEYRLDYLFRFVPVENINSDHYIAIEDRRHG